MYKSAIFFIGVSLLSGCASNYTEIKRADETKPINTENATIVGFVSEGFITQPHGLHVVLKYENKNPEDIKTLISLDTLGVKDEVPSNNILGNTFVYQIPAGMYEMTHWYYYHYNGLSKKIDKPIKFSVAPGEVAYIGNIHGNSLTMCLSNRDDYDTTINKIKSSHPILGNANIINKSADIQFPGWPHDNSTDVMGKGLCKIL